MSIRLKRTVQTETTPTLNFEVVDDLDAAVDFTGKTVNLMVKKRITDADVNAIIDRVCTLNVDPTTGKCSIVLTLAETATPEDTIAELRIDDGSGVIDKVEQFDLEIIQAVHRS